MELGVFVSGHLGYVNLRHLLDKQYPIKVIATDSRSQSIIELSRSQGIPLFTGNPREKKASNALTEMNISFDLLVSINYLFILEQDIISYPRIGAINFHGSLLPKYRGRTPHVWAIINGEKETGITAHFVEPGCDEGPVIDQILLPINDEDTGGSILDRFQQCYPEFVLSVISKFGRGVVSAKPQDEGKATFFGKRTPEDGRIMWTWQKERIRNWVRALSWPYPGAFCFYRGEKIVVDKIVNSDAGFNFTDPDGLILEEGKLPTVKTPNGAIKIESTRNDTYFFKGDILL